MPETRGPGRAQAKPNPQREGMSPQANDPGDPRKHAADLLDQADRLIELAEELRGEAQRLNASLAAPESRTRRGRAEIAAPARKRRFASPSEQASPELDGEVKSGELPISDGARLLITNMALLGASREEILGMMRDELGLEKPDAILEQLRL